MPGFCPSSFEASQVCRPWANYPCTDDCVVYDGSATAGALLLSAHADAQIPSGVVVFNDGFTSEAAWLDTLYPDQPGPYNYQLTVTMNASGYACCTNEGAWFLGAAAWGFSRLVKGNPCTDVLWERTAVNTVDNPVVELNVTETVSGSHSGPLSLGLGLNAGVNVNYAGGYVAYITAAVSYEAALSVPFARASEICSVPIAGPCHDCPSQIGAGPAKWRVRSGNDLVNPQTSEPNDAGYFDCSKPTVLLLHGWTDSPYLDKENRTGINEWMYETALGVGADGHFPSGVNILYADAQTLLRPSGRDWAVADNCVPNQRLRALKDAWEAASNIGDAVNALATDLRCIGCNQLNVPMIIGHSYGGAIGALISQELKRKADVTVGTLVTIDTPWWVPLVWAAGDAANSATCHINLYATQPYEGGVGTALGNPNTVEKQKDRPLMGSCLDHCAHACMATEFGLWLLVGNGWDEITNNWCSQTGTYWHEVAEQWNFVPGPGEPPPVPPDELYGVSMILDSSGHTITDTLVDVIDDFGLDYERVGNEIRISTSGNELPGLAYGHYTMPTNAGFLGFEYQLIQPAADEIMSLSFGDRLLWTAYSATEPDVWTTAVVCVGGSAGQTQSLIFALTPGALPAPSDMLKIRNVRLYDNRIFLLPGDLNCDGTVDFGDINPFVLALSNLSGYATTYPQCDILNGDINADGLPDFGDINPFVALLTGK
jgi:pimeloyl-ACP methyl ester carboxylesterase